MMDPKYILEGLGAKDYEFIGYELKESGYFYHFNHKNQSIYAIIADLLMLGPEDL
jgi:uncharacterized protein involved in type VI secretion and phage assembly